MPTKDELDKQIAKLEKQIAKLKSELAAARNAVPMEPTPVFGADAVPLEQR